MIFKVKTKILMLLTLSTLLTVSACSGGTESNGSETPLPTPEITAVPEPSPPPSSTSTSKSNPTLKSVLNPKSSESQEAAEKSATDLSPYFGNLTGSAVFLGPSGIDTVYNETASETRVSPCSTFKIVSTLAAFECGIVTPSESVIEWDGTEWAIDAWNKDLTIQEAFQSSCVWYYRKLIDRVGKENMAAFLERLDYGNRDISQWEGNGSNNGNPLIGGFWLESSLKISPQEQANLMRRIFEGETEIDENSIAELKQMMHTESGNGNYKLYGKTGTGKGGWYVGFFEAEESNTYFAVRLDEQAEANGQKAKEIACGIIDSLTPSPQTQRVR